MSVSAHILRFVGEPFVIENTCLQKRDDFPENINRSKINRLIGISLIFKIPNVNSFNLNKSNSGNCQRMVGCFILTTHVELSLRICTDL